MSVLIVVFSPLQFLNALEYLRNKKQGCEILVLTTDKTNIAQIRKIESEFMSKFPLLAFGFLNVEMQWVIKLAYVKWMVKIKNYETVVIGNFNNVIGYYLAVKFSKIKKEVVLLDDGLATVKIYTDRNVHNIKYNKSIFGGKFIDVYRNLLGLNSSNEIPNLEFYTSYDLEKKQKAVYDQVVIQDKEKISHKVIQEDLVWFIGSPVVEYGILPREKYDLVIRSMVEKLKNNGKKIHYILHRFEDEKIEGLTYKKFDKPLEVIFQELEVLPEFIISFYSSALINLASIYDSLICEYIDISKLGVENEAIKNVYNLMKIHENLREFKIDNNGM